MWKAMLIISLLMSPLRSAEPEGAFEEVLRTLRAERPELALYLVNRPVTHFRNSPENAAEDALMHDPQWVLAMERSGIISGSCTPPRNVLGCTPPDSAAGRPILSAGFWPLECFGNDRVKVAVTLVLPSIRQGVANVEKREYTLERTYEREWRVISSEVVGIS
jgi:hypothetical protein